MERPAKRQRIYVPLDRRFPHRFDDQDQLYENQDSELEEEGEDYDPDEELQVKRAQVDNKLKSTFESIFEKYGRDFEGIADEVDLYTGEILVNNGHLIEMEDEKDAGIPEIARRMLASTTPETEEVTNSSAEEDDIEDEEDDDEETMSDEEMNEDDMLLRGFAQASQFMQKRQLSQEPTSSMNDFIEPPEPPRRLVASRPSLGLPSLSEIMSQFGPELGPEIVKYVKQQGALEDTSIEPAWRAPPLPSTSPKKRTKVRPIAPLVEIERSPSPENELSIWAPERKTRNRGPKFTKEDDELLLDFVAKARRRGLEISSQLTWKQLEAAYPHHGWNSWKIHYKRKFSFFSPGNVDESELSTSETSTGFRLPPAPVIKNNEFRSSIVGAQRSTRIRKPAQRDPNVISWSEAVPILESGDPFQHAELLRDAGRTRIGASFRYNQPTPTSTNIPESHLSQKNSVSTHRLDQYPDISSPLRRSKNRINDIHSDAEDELALHDSTPLRESSERVPCPHVGCQNYPSATYRTTRNDNEKLSPLVEHLWHVHQSAPYPCREPNCDRNGNQGYFMQIELVQHVKEVHPYPTALQQLRGRIDSEFLDPKFYSRQLHASAATPRPYKPGGAPIDSDFLSLQGRRPISVAQQLPPTPAHHQSSTPRDARGVSRASLPAGSSPRVNSSSTTTRDAQVVISGEKNYDSDVQILNGNPFPERITPTKGNKVYACPLKDSLACEKKFTTASSAVYHARVHTSEKAQCSYPGCKKMISTAQAGPMKVHLEWHERERIKLASIQTANADKSQPLTPSSIPDSQSSSTYSTYAVPISIPLNTNSHDSTNKQVAPPLHRNTVDPSYDFSDEEEITQPASVKVPLEVSRKMTHTPLQSELSAVSPVAKALQLSTKPTPRKNGGCSSVTKLPVAPPLITPLAKKRLQKPIHRDDLDTEDLDELSLGADDFVLISSRPRSRPQPMIESHAHVKREHDIIPSSELPIRKRRSSALDSDEIDELATDEPQCGRSAGLQSHIKRELDSSTERVQPMTRPTKATRKRLSGDAIVSASRAGRVSHSQLPIPAKIQHQPTRTSTPLIDLTPVGNSSIHAATGSRPNISVPSTSEVRSSPLSQRRTQKAMPESSSPLLALLTPVREKHWAAKTIKQEEADGVVKTPGGTMRRCGDNGFTCGRQFCFTCGGSAAVT